MTDRVAADLDERGVASSTRPACRRPSPPARAARTPRPGWASPAPSPGPARWPGRRRRAGRGPAPARRQALAAGQLRRGPPRPSRADRRSSSGRSGPPSRQRADQDVEPLARLERGQGQQEPAVGQAEPPGALVGVGRQGQLARDPLPDHLAPAAGPGARPARRPPPGGDDDGVGARAPRARPCGGASRRRAGSASPDGSTGRRRGWSRPAGPPRPSAPAGSARGSRPPPRGTGHGRPRSQAAISGRRGSGSRRGAAHPGHARRRRRPGARRSSPAPRTGRGPAARAAPTSAAYRAGPARNGRQELLEDQAQPHAPTLGGGSPEAVAATTVPDMQATSPAHSRAALAERDARSPSWSSPGRARTCWARAWSRCAGRRCRTSVIVVDNGTGRHGAPSWPTVPRGPGRRRPAPTSGSPEAPSRAGRRRHGDVVAPEQRRGRPSPGWLAALARAAGELRAPPR